MKITFIGATDDVTGSMTLVDLPAGQILIDSGMTQGGPEVLAKNFLPLPFSPKVIKAILLTHAHLDHCGAIPHLVKMGFRGKIYCTLPTSKLVAIILKDSATLIAENPDERFQQFYTMEDVTHTLSLFHPVIFHQPFDLAGALVEFIPAGHILGASSISITSDKKVVFSGDLGRDDDPIMPGPESCPSADIVVVESTYGGKERTANIEQDLYAFLDKIFNESTVGLMASFAVARAQMLTYLIQDYFTKFPEKKIRLVMDGPMIKQANHVYQQYANQTKIPNQLFQAIEETEMIEHQGEWESLRKKTGPLLIISSSGMVNGGRIWRHLENWADDDRAILFLPGYQGRGTPGRELSEGKRLLTTPKGKVIQWTGKILHSEAFSSHADQPALLKWLGPADQKKDVYLIHGESEAKQHFQQKLLSIGFEKVSLPVREQFIE